MVLGQLVEDEILFGRNDRTSGLFYIDWANILIGSHRVYQGKISLNDLDGSEIVRWIAYPVNGRFVASSMRRSEVKGFKLHEDKALNEEATERYIPEMIHQYEKIKGISFI